MERVSRIRPFERLTSQNAGTRGFWPGPQEKKKPRRLPKRHFKALSELVDETHRELVEQASPFRLCVYLDGDEVFLDVIAINEEDGSKAIFKNNIADEAYEELVQKIDSRVGLLFETSV